MDKLQPNKPRRVKSCGSCGKYKSCHQRGIINPCDDWRPVTSIGNSSFVQPPKSAKIPIVEMPAKVESAKLFPAMSESIAEIAPRDINNPMFGITQRGLENRVTGEIIPEDEPVFILLGRSKHAGASLRTFQSQFETLSEEHDNIETVLAEFKAFKELKETEVNDDDAD